jgi:hypothetical protein
MTDSQSASLPVVVDIPHGCHRIEVLMRYSGTKFKLLVGI